MCTPPGRAARGERGQALVEFGLVLPVLVLLFMAIVDFGYIFAIQAAVVTSADEGARYGSTLGDNGSGTPRYVDCAGIRQATRRVTGGLMTIADTQVRITYDDGSGVATTDACPPDGMGPVATEISTFDRVIVEVTMVYGPISPLVSAIVGPITVTSIDRRTIVKAGP